MNKMKNLKISEFNQRLESAIEIKKFENEFKIEFPDDLIELLLNYEGAKLNEDECYFEHKKGLFYEVNQILYLRKSDLGGASIQDILKGHKSYGIEGFIPFAIDSGGWDFNISVNESTLGQVWVNKFDSDEEKTMIYVAPSLENFINSLKSDV
ncbi:MAG: SMI1/KNR4 family protein [Cyclobacteriaceae bacterium]